MIDEKDIDRGDDLPTPPAVEAEVEAEVIPSESSGDKLEPEGAETAEEKAEREKAEADAEAKRRIRIPKSRFDEAQAKARAREQRLLEEIAELKGGKQAASVRDALTEAKSKINDLQDKYEDMILDGKRDEARKIRQQIDVLRDDLIEHQTSVKSDAARRGALEELTFNAQLASVEQKYPTLNPEFENFDEEATNEVVELMKAFITSGASRTDALHKAVKYVMGTAPVAATPKTAADNRAVEARKRAAEADKRQPPSASKVGLDSDRAGSSGAHGVNVSSLTQDKFAKLDESTLSKLRGDEA